MRTKWTALLALMGIAAAGCDSDNDFRNNAMPEPSSFAGVQVLHASPDAPLVNVSGVTAAPITNVDYKTGTATQNVRFQSGGGLTGVTVDGILPDGSTTTVIGPVDIPLTADMLYTIIAIGDDLAIEPLVLSQPFGPASAGNTKLRVVHAAPNAPEVSVFLTAPGADLAAAAPVTTFAFSGDAGPVEVPAGGPYQIRVTLPFTPPAAPTVVFDSGEISLAAGANLLIAAVENTTSADGINAEDSPISLVVMDGTGSAEILDVNAAAEVRVVHASADTPAVDVIVNDDFANPLVDALTFPNFVPAPTGFVEVPADIYDISVVDDATQTAEPIDIDGLALDAGVAYDVLAINEFANVDALLAIDDFRRLETAAKVRLIHASTVADAASPTGVDVYVTDPSVTDLSTVAPAIDNFLYGTNTGFVQLDPGQYVVSVTADGSTMPLIQTPTLDLTANGIYTAIARDPDPTVANDVPGLILLDDFN